MRLPPIAVALVLGATASGCAKDVVQPDVATEPECGNGVLESGEQCDVASPGCSACEIVPGWRCDATGCSVVCGDGVVGSGPACASPHRDSDCDMTGYWAVRETEYERDDVVGSIQTSSTWYLFHLAQSGDAFQVVESLDCGLHTSGTVNVDLTPPSLRANMYANRMDDASGPHGARRGTSRPGDGGCDVSLDRWYKIRGAVESLLPGDFSADAPLESLPPLPSVSDPVTSTEDPPGAVDVDGDGIPGMGFVISGFVSGTRHSAQRDWKEFATPAGTSVPAAALTFAFPGAHDLQESILRVTDCGTACPLVASSAHVAQNVPPHVTFSFIGKTLGSPRTSEVVAAAPRQSLDADLTTCANVRLVLPHDPTLPPGVSGSSL